KRKVFDEPVADDGLGDYLARVDGDDIASVSPRERPMERLEPIADGFTRQASSETMTSEPAKPHGIAPPDDEENRTTTLRVSAPAPPAKKSKRALAEAQPTLPVFKEPGEFELPALHFLTEPPANRENQGLSPEALAHNAQLLEDVLEDFGVKGEIIHVRPGPVVTLYELEPAPGIKSSRVIGLADDIARSMSATSARIAVVPGKNAMGIELPNETRETVYLKTL
ncbi:MAG: DNA translocase FtsK, partial [Pseudomonadota bacterium]